YCTTVQMPTKLPAIPVCRDVNDLEFLQLALVGKADFLVSGDNDLLSLTGQFAWPILTAGQFFAKLNEWGLGNTPD
ncbi:MAG: putative toxin-antitoxin system toxin component, PIN family, partial [Burkholderiales bacterium]